MPTPSSPVEVYIPTEQAEIEELHHTLLALVVKTRVSHGQIGEIIYKFRKSKGWRTLGHKTHMGYLHAYKIPHAWYYTFGQCYETFTVKYGLPVQVWETIDISRLAKVLPVISEGNCAEILDLAKNADTRRGMARFLKRLRSERIKRGEHTPGQIYRLVPIEPEDFPRKDLKREMLSMDFFRNIDDNGDLYAQSLKRQ